MHMRFYDADPLSVRCAQSIWHTSNSHLGLSYWHATIHRMPIFIHSGTHVMFTFARDFAMCVSVRLPVRSCTVCVCVRSFATWEHIHGTTLEKERSTSYIWGTGIARKKTDTPNSRFELNTQHDHHHHHHHAHAVWCWLRYLSAMLTDRSLRLSLHRSHASVRSKPDPSFVPCNY